MISAMELSSTALSSRAYSISHASHLSDLEAEAIQIVVEAHVQAINPVLLYSIGKDSSVLLNLARKAFAPAQLPFPLLHIDTLWKFADVRLSREDTIAAWPSNVWICESGGRHTQHYSLC